MFTISCRGMLMAYFLLLLYLPVQAQTDPDHPNILLIIADDLGLDVTNGYYNSPIMPTTPVLDSLRNTGVTFQNAWTAPQCSPTRAGIMSGKYGINNNVQRAPGNLDAGAHNSIFKEIASQTSDAYDDAVIGKWHISNPADYTHPNQHGVDFYTGSFMSSVSDYYAWDKLVGNTLQTETTYATEDFTTEAITWVNGRSKPWFLWLAHVAPHSPFHVPPSNMYSIGNTGNNTRKYIAAIEAMDYQIGRLMAAMDPAVRANTIILFIGDNGTPGGVMQTYPTGRGKSTMYQGGINVPLIVSGKGVSRQNESEAALVNSVDLFSTIIEATGGTLPGGQHNSYSFFEFLSSSSATGRPYNYVDYQSGGTGGDDFAIRNNQFKLIQFADGSQEFYDLSIDPFESNDLLLGTLNASQQAAYDDLELEAVYIRTDWSCRDLILNGVETDIDTDGTYCTTAPVCTFDNSTSTSNIGCCRTPNNENHYDESVFNGVRSISTSNFPDHDYCQSGGNVPSPTYYTFDMPEEPIKAASTTSIISDNNRPDRFYGIGMNGVLIAPAPATPFIYENPNTGEYNWNWVFEPTNNQGSGPSLVGLDCASAHTGPQGYHYHGNMFQYAEKIQTGISTTSTPPSGAVQIGWASDGFPIVYRFGPDGVGGLKLLQPSYSLKAGERPGDGVNAPCGPYNGKYTNDYEYVAGLGDLDECNGIDRDITINTVCGPQTFPYFYVVTDNFPQIGRCLVGTPDATFDNGQGSDACLTTMFTQEITLNGGSSITVGSNTYTEAGTYRDVLTNSFACDSIVITKITSVLPLDLLSFEALYRKNFVHLIWNTANEENVSHFEVERSSDARRFEPVATRNAKAQGNNSYAIQDALMNVRIPVHQELYYRLKMIDEDGSFVYSNVASVYIDRISRIDVQFLGHNALYLAFDADAPTKLWIKIHDIVGNEIQALSGDFSNGNTKILDGLQNWNTGMYIVSVGDENGLFYSKKILIP